MVLYYVLGALILEAVTFRLLNLGIMPEYFLFNFSLIMIIAMAIFIIPSYTAQFILYSIILIIQTIFVYVNYSLLTIYGDLFSFEMMGLMREATAAISSEFIYFSTIFQLALVFVSIIIIGLLLLKYCKKEKFKIKQHFSFVNVFIIILCQCLSLGVYISSRIKVSNFVEFNDVGYTQSDAFLMNTSILKVGSYEKFGTYGYFSNLIINHLTDSDKMLKKSAVDYFNSGKIYDGTDYEQGQENLSIFGDAKDNNVIVIMMESLEWFCFGNGIYDPTFNNFSDELLPNIYSVINSENSLVAKGFFAKSKTNFSEGHGFIGQYPIGQSLTDIAGQNYNKNMNSFGYTMPNVLKNHNYTTNYVHSNVSTFYNRNLTHNNLGFDNVIGKENVIKMSNGQNYAGKELSWEHWEAEGDFARNAIDYIVPKNYDEKPFYSFYLNVSSHGSYSYNENEADCLRYKDYVMYGREGCEWNDETKVYSKKSTTSKYSNWYQNVLNQFAESDPKLVEELLYYQCGVCGLDEAIGVILDKLEDYNILDKTTILMYSDHYSYYNSLSNRLKGIDSNEAVTALNSIPMIISSPCLKEYADSNYPNRTTAYLENQRFSSAYDIIPTLLDMLGIKFNENLYIGHSLFRPADYVYSLDGAEHDMVVYYSNTGGLYSRDLYTYDMKNFVLRNKLVSNEIVELFKSEASQILRKINYMHIMNNYNLYNNLTNF